MDSTNGEEASGKGSLTFRKWKGVVAGCNKFRKKCLKSPLTSVCAKCLFVFVNFAFLVSGWMDGWDGGWDGMVYGMGWWMDGWMDE